MALILIFIGGGFGSICRYLLGRVVQSQSHSGFPVGTLAVNVVGCVVIGLLAKLLMHAQTENLWRAALMVGVCGGFTTFSTFSLETLGLVNGGEWARAAAYVLASLIACLIGTAAGFRFGPSLNP